MILSFRQTPVISTYSTVIFIIGVPSNYVSCSILEICKIDIQNYHWNDGSNCAWLRSLVDRKLGRYTTSDIVFRHVLSQNKDDQIETCVHVLFPQLKTWLSRKKICSKGNNITADSSCKDWTFLLSFLSCVWVILDELLCVDFVLVMVN